MKKSNELKSLYIDIYSKKILIFASINFLIMGLFNINIIELLSNKIHKSITIFIYIIIGLAGIYNIGRRDFYLSFLDKSVYPCGSLIEKKPVDATIKKTIKTKPNIKVIDWASEYDKNIFEDPYIAYDKYANTGVVKSDNDGNAVLEFRKPQGYNAPYKNKILKPHVHYRECFYEGMLDSVKTLYL